MTLSITRSKLVDGSTPRIFQGKCPPACCAEQRPPISRRTRKQTEPRDFYVAAQRRASDRHCPGKEATAMMPKPAASPSPKRKSPHIRLGRNASETTRHSHPNTFHRRIKTSKCAATTLSLLRRHNDDGRERALLKGCVAGDDGDTMTAMWFLQEQEVCMQLQANCDTP